MAALLQNAFQAFFIFGLLLLFVVSIIILKPFRIHHKRPVTTISLKVTYLIFLGHFLIFTYLLLFGPKTYNEDVMPYDTLFNKHFLFFISSTIIPSFGIMVRRRIRNKRVTYNLIFSFINIMYTGYFLYAIGSGKWAML